MFLIYVKDNLIASRYFKWFTSLARSPWTLQRRREGVFWVAW